MSGKIWDLARNLMALLLMVLSIFTGPMGGDYAQASYDLLLAVILILRVRETAGAA